VLINSTPRGTVQFWRTRILSSYGRAYQLSVFRDYAVSTVQRSVRKYLIQIVWKLFSTPACCEAADIGWSLVKKKQK